VAEARVTLEQARAAEAERARAAAEAAAAAAAAKAAAEAVEAAERQRLEEEVAALACSVRSDALRLQQMQAQLGSSVGPPEPAAEETLCVVCFDAPKDHIIIPCGHVCVCQACANLLTQREEPSCPICRTAILQTNKVFHS
jgi:hypothetical protein